MINYWIQEAWFLIGYTDDNPELQARFETAMAALTNVPGLAYHNQIMCQDMIFDYPEGIADGSVLCTFGLDVRGPKILLLCAEEA